MSETEKMSRRSFLKKAAVASAVVGFPYVIPGRVLGLDGAVAPSNRITYGFIGIGGGIKVFGDRHGAQFIAVCEVQKSKRDLCLANYKNAKGYSDFREMIARPDLDAVFICTSPHWHTLLTSYCAKAGKDVYCEKPTACTVRESIEIRNVIRRYGRVFQTGSQYMSQRPARMCAAVVRSGRLGKLTKVYHSASAENWPWEKPRVAVAKPVPEGMDWDLWLGPNPWEPYNGVTAIYRGGEPVGYDWGSHKMNILAKSLSCDRTKPVECLPNTKDHPYNEWKLPDGVILRNLPENKMLVDQLKLPWKDQPFSENRDKVALIWECEEGWVTWHWDPTACVVIRKDGRVNRVEEEPPITPGELAMAPIIEHTADFIECIKTRRRCFGDVEEDGYAMMLLHLSTMANHLGRSVTWDFAKETFVNDPEAVALMDRPKRAPWHY